MKATSKEIFECLHTVQESLPEGNVCSLALEKQDSGRGRGGHHRGFPLEKIDACIGEIDFDCGLDFDIFAFAEELRAIEAEREAKTCRCGHECVMDDGESRGMCQADSVTCSTNTAVPTCDEHSAERELVKQKMEVIRQCLMSLKDELPEESECAVALDCKPNEEVPTPIPEDEEPVVFTKIAT